MKSPVFLSLLLFMGVCADAASAAGPSPATRWERGAALAAVNSVNRDAVVTGIVNPASLANARSTLEKLEQLETRSDWPLPAREAALHELTRALAELPRAAVAPGVLAHLRNYEARTLVPDADHGGTLVPLFNIRAAALGVENGWQRKEFAVEAIALLRTDPAKLVPAYLGAGGPNQRSGYLDALREADLTAVFDVQQAALDTFGRAPELTPVVALTATLTADAPALRQLLVHGAGAALPAALRQLDQVLQPAEKAGLLQFAMREAPAGNASLAIAAWWPGLRHVAAVRDLLIENLADPELGSAAALALANGPDVQTIRALQQTAQGDGVAARRAQMALDINREQLTLGSRP